MKRAVVLCVCACFIPLSAFSAELKKGRTLGNLCHEALLGRIKAVEPKAKKDPKDLVTHGHKRVDNYYWMNQRDSAPVLDYVNAENAYTEKVFNDPSAEFQTELFDEIKGRIKLDSMSAPNRRVGKDGKPDVFYYQRNEADKQYPIICRRTGSMEATEEVIMDVNAMAADQEFYQLGGAAVSPDQKYFAFTQDTTGRRIYELFVKNLETGEIKAMGVKNSSGDLVWANDSETIYYVTQDDETLRSDRLFRMNKNSLEKEELLFESDEEFYISLSKSNSKKYIFINSFQTMTSEVQAFDADDPKASAQLIRPRTEGVRYNVEDSGKGFLIYTNEEAVNFKVMKAAYGSPDQWQEFIPHDESSHITDMEPLRGKVLIEQRVNGVNEIKIYDTETSDFKNLSSLFVDESYVAGLGGIEDFENTKFRYTYETMTSPAQVIDYDFATEEQVIVKEDVVLGDFNSKDYETKRIMVTARDGVKVPVSIAYKKGTELSAAPTLLYSYGSYGHTVDPRFSSPRLSLLNRGFVMAIAHIRGGAYMGRQWYEDGKLLKKKNTFTDYIDVGQALVSQGVAHKDKLFGMGGSAGGLLMGAVANMAPEGLFQGLVAQVPFVDVVTTMLDESIPLTTFEYDEWGNPNEKEFYEYMLSYSPVDNVTQKNYPHMLITTGYHDSQVQYWEPLKWTAKLRDLRANNNLLLLDTDMKSGHGGASGRFDAMKDLAKEYAFMFHVLEKEAKGK